VAVYFIVYSSDSQTALQSQKLCEEFRADSNPLMTNLNATEFSKQYYVVKINRSSFNSAVH
jgi:hypothetical protein